MTSTGAERPTDASGYRPRRQETIANADVLVMQLETPLETVRAAAELAAARGVRVILNPAPAQPLSDDLLRHVSVLTPNESEAERLTGITVANREGAVRAADWLRGKVSIR